MNVLELIEMLKDDKVQGEVLGSFALALWEIGDVRAVEPLIGLLKKITNSDRERMQ